MTSSSPDKGQNTIQRTRKLHNAPVYRGARAKQMAQQKTDSANGGAGDPNATGSGDMKPIRDDRAAGSAGAYGTLFGDRKCKDQYLGPETPDYAGKTGGSN